MDGMVNATILAQVQGYLIKQNYKEGDFVKKGALLFEIDPRPFQAAVDEARAGMAKQQAVLQTAQANLKRILPLAAANAVSQRDKDNAIGSVQSAEAQVLASQAQVRKAELDLGFTRIASPIDGIAGAAKAQMGDLVGTPQARELTTVSTVNPIKAYVPISEREYLQAVEKSKQDAKADAEKTTFDLILADGSTWPQERDVFLCRPPGGVPDRHHPGGHPVPQPREPPAAGAVRQGARADEDGERRDPGAAARGRRASGQLPGGGGGCR